MSPTLSVVIPAFNEARFIGTLLEQIAAVDLAALGVNKELVVVDDCSTDRTSQIVSGYTSVRLHRMPSNGGKGRAVRAGLALATGEWVIIQDADLEYDPRDYVPMMRAILERQGDVVYGSRYMSGWKHPRQSWTAYLGGRSLSLVCRVCTGTYLSDTVTALKLFPRSLLTTLDLQTSGFELDHEITAKVLARRLKIVEVPIHYDPRSREEGKKIGARDWLIGTRTFVRFRNG